MSSFSHLTMRRRKGVRFDNIITTAILFVRKKCLWSWREHVFHRLLIFIVVFVPRLLRLRGARIPSLEHDNYGKYIDRFSIDHFLFIDFLLVTHTIECLYKHGTSNAYSFLYKLQVNSHRNP